MTTICKASVHGLMKSMNSSLLQIGGNKTTLSKLKKKIDICVGGNALDIPIANLVLL